MLNKDLLAGKIQCPRVFTYHEKLRLEGRLRGQDTYTKSEIQKQHWAKLAAAEMCPPAIIGMQSDVLQTRMNQVSMVLPIAKWPVETFKQLIQRSSQELLHDPAKFHDTCWPYHSPGEQPQDFNPMAPRARDVPSVLPRLTEVAVARFVRDFFATHTQQGEQGAPMVMKMAEIVSDAFLPDDAPADIVGLKHDASAIAAIIQEGLCTGKQAECLMRLQRRSKVNGAIRSIRMTRIWFLRQGLFWTRAATSARRARTQARLGLQMSVSFECTCRHMRSGIRCDGPVEWHVGVNDDTGLVEGTVVIGHSVCCRRELGTQRSREGHNVFAAI